MHESLDVFKFRPDTDTNTRVICPCASEKLLYNVVFTLAPSFYNNIKVPNFLTPENFAVIYLKFKQRGQTLAYFIKKMQME